MSSLKEIIIERIKKEGPITFEAFMDMALYYPELGYYTSEDTTIGRHGDFYTSSHLHPVFGAMIARQLMEMWTLMGRPPVFTAVEVGAGAGYLCKDIFDYLNRPSQESAVFLQSLRYVIVEPFHHFEKRQQKLLNEHRERLAWVKSLNDLSNVTGCVLSNELLDAFPVRLVEMEDELKEIYVNFDGKQFVEEKREISSGGITEYIDEFRIKLPQGCKTEINLQIREWLREAASVLSSGFILTIDYGYSTGEYYDSERTNGTLLCYHEHLFNENPFRNVGEQDITAHVNFSSLKKWGEGLGLKTIGYCPQGTFLTAAGIDEVITELCAGSKDYLSEISKIKGLIMPHGMGASHNFMVQYKGKGSPQIRGFSIRDLAGSL
ncbi:MAG: SAM-dependent methyltransferase [Nitrospirota bacterium]|nr:SAM-dependent methyltransferase [Nitrospirota bacterium]